MNMETITTTNSVKRDMDILCNMTQHSQSNTVFEIKIESFNE